MHRELLNVYRYFSRLGNGGMEASVLGGRLRAESVCACMYIYTHTQQSAVEVSDGGGWVKVRGKNSHSVSGCRRRRRRRLHKLLPDQTVYTIVYMCARKTQQTHAITRGGGDHIRRYASTLEYNIHKCICMCVVCAMLCSASLHQHALACQIEQQNASFTFTLSVLYFSLRTALRARGCVQDISTIYYIWHTIVYEHVHVRPFGGDTRGHKVGAENAKSTMTFSCRRYTDRKLYDDGTKVAGVR